MFASGVKLGFSDPRRLGRILLRANAVNEAPIKDLAPDAFLDIPSAEVWREQLLARHKPVKAILLDQNLVCSGIGNWIADEVLFQAEVHPGNHCSTLSDSQLESVRLKVREVCSLACSVNADSSQFPKDWLFHYRWGKGKESPAMPDGSRITSETHGGRTSAIVAKVQRKGNRDKATKTQSNSKKPRKNDKCKAEVKQEVGQEEEAGQAPTGRTGRAKRKRAAPPTEPAKRTVRRGR